jgi:hypothetical protein
MKSRTGHPKLRRDWGLASRDNGGTGVVQLQEWVASRPARLGRCSELVGGGALHEEILIGPCESSWRLMEEHGEYRVEATEMRRYEE